MPKEKEKFDKNKYNSEYSSKHYVRRSLSLKAEEDKDVIDVLDSKPSMTTYVKELIRADIAKNGRNENE